MYFVDEEHKKYFDLYKHKADGYGKDVLSAIYLIGSMDITRNANIIDYNSMMINDIDDGAWAFGEMLIHCIARHLFTGSDDFAVNIADCAVRLDVNRRRAVLQAFEFRFFGAVD